MALYNVESPGGYQLTGLTIPGVDILGSKKGYSLDRPWLFEDFDQLTFYKVSEENMSGNWRSSIVGGMSISGNRRRSI
jgi:allophanate hydrolase subunit 1